jgi:hypothetical protein
MKSKEAKEILREIAKELDLPYSSVEDAVRSVYLTMKETVADVETRNVRTDDQYDKLKKKISMKYLGSLKITGRYHVLRKNKQKDNYGST